VGRAYAGGGLRSTLGTSYVPPRALGLAFDDVAPDSFGSDFVEDAARRGYMAPCGERLWCPDAVVTRGETARTLLRLIEGPGYVPPPAVGQFTDVGAALAPFAEEVTRRGIMAGCSATQFCPGGSTTRADHAIWLVRGFGFRTYATP